MSEDPELPKLFKPHFYSAASLRETNGKVSFVLENSSGEDLTVTKITALSFDGRFVPPDDFIFLSVKKEVWKPSAIDDKHPLLLKQNIPLQIIIRNLVLSEGMVNVRLLFVARGQGEIIVDVNENFK